MSTIWSLDVEGELKGAYRDSKIPNFYVMVRSSLSLFHWQRSHND